MQRKKLLITTVHPAPYIDRLVTHLNSEYDITVIYNALSDKYKTWKNYSWTKGYVFTDLSLREIIDLIKSADFIIVGGWGSWDCIKLIILSKILAKKIAVFSDCPIYVNKRTAQFWFKRLFLFKIIEYIFCATPSTQEIYSKHYNFNRDKLKIFPYAIDFQDINYIGSINMIRNKELIKGSSPRIFISNSFYQRKGYNILYQMFEEIAKSNLLDKFEVKIAGLGDDYQEYKLKFESLSSKIKLLGWLEYDDYREEMNNTDIFIHASLFEPFGIPPIDAMARGKLLIVSDGVQSTCSIIEQGVNGYTYTASEPNEISSIIEGLRMEQIYDIGQNAIKTTNLYYSYERFSNVLHECIELSKN